MENNQHPIYVYIDDLQEQGRFISPQQYQSEERNPPQVENYPVMQTAMSCSPALPSIVNQEISDLTQPLMVSTSSLFFYFNVWKDSTCLGLESSYII